MKLVWTKRRPSYCLLC